MNAIMAVLAVVLAIGLVFLIHVGISAVIAFPVMWLFNAVSGHFGGPLIPWWISFCGVLLLSFVGGHFRSSGKDG